MDKFNTEYNNTKLGKPSKTIKIKSVIFSTPPGVWDHSPGFRNVFASDLAEIQRLLPPNIVEIMRGVVIYINISYRYPGHLENTLGACCHNSSEWLLEVRKLFLTIDIKVIMKYPVEWKSSRKGGPCGDLQYSVLLVLAPDPSISKTFKYIY